LETKILREVSKSFSLLVPYRMKFSFWSIKTPTMSILLPIVPCCWWWWWSEFYLFWHLTPTQYKEGKIPREERSGSVKESRRVKVVALAWKTVKLGGLPRSRKGARKVREGSGEERSEEIIMLPYGKRVAPVSFKAYISIEANEGHSSSPFFFFFFFF